ncbi:hypothetical protein WDU94_011816 [Cyamophila willieti]
MPPNIEAVDQTRITIEPDDSNNKTIANDPNTKIIDNDPTVTTSNDKLNHPDLPQDLKEYLSALNEHLPNDYMVPIDFKPTWMDIEKCKRGQKFAQQYYFGVNYAEMISLYLLFLDHENLGVLIYTQKSHTPFKAYRRYLSTVLRVKSWLETEFWNPNELGYKNLKIVRAMHLNVSKKLNETNPKEFLDQFSVIDNPKYHDGVWATLTEDLKEDLSSVQCPMTGAGVWSSKCPAAGDRRIFINQFNMSMTQFGFVGLLILYPDKFGASNASDEDLEAFAHLWKAIGYYLGIKDKYNFCKGDLIEIRQRCTDVLNYWIKPNLTGITLDWEHMCRCMTEGVSYYVPGVNFETSFKYLCWVLDIKTPKLDSKMSIVQSFSFYSNQFIMCYATKVPWILNFLNWAVKVAIKKASKDDPNILAKLQKKTYSYQNECSKL